MPFCSAFLLLLGLLGQAQAQEAIFTSPANQITQSDFSLGLNFVYGKSATFTWNTNVTTGVSLYLQQQVNDSSSISASYVWWQILDLNNTQGSYAWDGVPAQNQSNGNSFFLQLYVAGIDPDTVLATSEYFNVSDPTGASTTSTPTSSASPTATIAPTTVYVIPASATSNAASSVTAASTTPTHSPTPKSDDSIAIGLGAGLGCALLLALLAAAFFFRRYKRKQRQAYPPPPPWTMHESQAGRDDTHASELMSSPQLHGDSFPESQREMKSIGQVNRSELQS
ncbi:hypothetical protein LTR85_011716 [Meristemomyces frigidus]|nr:hypothetical protein LTR85_011716 [Meristemomyces frigidus]